MSHGITSESQRITYAEAVQKFNDLDAKGMVPISLTFVGKMASRKAPTEKFTIPGYSGKGGETYYAKVSLMNGNLGINYEDKVNNQLTKEGKEANFEVGKSPYEYVSKAIRKKDNQFYLFYYPRSSSKEPIYVKRENGVFAEATSEEVFANVTARPEAPSNNQGTDKIVEVKTISLSSIVAFTIDKQSFIIDDIDDVRKEIISCLK